MKGLEYSFLKAEKNNEIVIFIKVEPEWLDKEIDLTYKENCLYIELLGGDIYKSSELESMLIDRLNTQDTPVIFCDDNGNFLAETDLLLSERQDM